MANPQHIAWLLEGVDKWNARREREVFVPDFEDARLPYKILSGINLNGANLRETQLEGTVLTKADLRNANLFLADLGAADLREADLRGANLMGSNLLGASLEHAALDDANFTTANVNEANLRGSEVWKAKGIFKDSLGDEQYLSSINENAVVGSVPKLIELLRNIDHPNHMKLYLRGEPAIRYKEMDFDLSPKVLRSDQDALHEAEFLTDFFRRQPFAAGREKSAISELIVAQHYGLKTRLLDITRNPLVALYFACNSTAHRNSDGRLHIFLANKFVVKSHNSDTIAVLANFAKLSKNEQTSVLTRKKFAPTRNDPLARLYHFIGTEKPHFQKRIDIADLFNVFIIEPKQEFERIKAQSGAFLISAFHERFEATEVAKLVPAAPIYQYTTVKIPASLKDKILAELALLNITEETLFPTMENSANAANNCV